jgi:hypothetical protein
MITILVAWTVVVAAAIVLALAGYLVAIAHFLCRAGGGRNSHLAKLTAAVSVIADNVKPLEARVAIIAGALAALRGELALVDRKLARTAAAFRR